MNEYKKPAFPKDIKRTKQREEIFNILLEETEPISALEIYNRLVQNLGNDSYAISTVYRALSVFEEKGYVTKSTLAGSDMAYYEWSHGVHKHYAMCLKCHKLVPLKECPVENKKMETNSDDFVVTGHKLEIYGYCNGCKPHD